jgi:hypothetical protein
VAPVQAAEGALCHERNGVNYACFVVAEGGQRRLWQQKAATPQLV